MLKRTVVRLLLFGIPFGLSYWATKPATPITVNQTVVVCAYPGDRPGELRINLDPAGCSESAGPKTAGAAPVSLLPAVNSPQGVKGNAGNKPLNLSF
jgi:hypothetical protein